MEETADNYGPATVNANADQELLLKEYKEVDQKKKKCEQRLNEIKEELKGKVPAGETVTCCHGNACWTSKSQAKSGGLDQDLFRSEILRSNLSTEVNGSRYLTMDLLDKVTPRTGAAWNGTGATEELFYKNHGLPPKFDLTIEPNQHPSHVG